MMRLVHSIVHSMQWNIYLFSLSKCPFALGTLFTWINLRRLNVTFAFFFICSIMNSLQSCYTVSITVLSSLSGKFSILQLIFTLFVYVVTYTIYFNFTSKYDIYESTTGKIFHNLLYGSYFTLGALIFVNYFVARSHLTSTSNVNSGTPTPSPHSQRKCNYNSNMMNQLILLGSIVLLYTFYPFVLSANVLGDKRHRIVINTLLALTASTVISFALTSIIDPKNRFNVVSLALVLHCVCVCMCVVSCFSCLFNVLVLLCRAFLAHVARERWGWGCRRQDWTSAIMGKMIYVTSAFPFASLLPGPRGWLEIECSSFFPFSPSHWPQRLIQVGIYSGASAITSVAGLMIHPYGALLIGFIAPILAVITFLYLLVSEKAKIP